MNRRALTLAHTHIHTDYIVKHIWIKYWWNENTNEKRMNENDILEKLLRSNRNRKFYTALFILIYLFVSFLFISFSVPPFPRFSVALFCDAHRHKMPRMYFHFFCKLYSSCWISFRCAYRYEDILLCHLAKETGPSNITSWYVHVFVYTIPSLALSRTKNKKRNKLLPY